MATSSPVFLTHSDSACLLKLPQRRVFLMFFFSFSRISVSGAQNLDVFNLMIHCFSVLVAPSSCGVFRSLSSSRLLDLKCLLSLWLCPYFVSLVIKHYCIMLNVAQNKMREDFSPLIALKWINSLNINNRSKRKVSRETINFGKAVSCSKRIKLKLYLWQNYIL